MVSQSKSASETMGKVLSARGIQTDGRTFYLWSEGEQSLFWIPAHCSSGDYCGNLLERANIQTLEEALTEIEKEQEIQIHFILRESYGTDSLCLFPRALAFPEIVDLVNSLSDYPLLDESLLSELESEAQDRAWQDWGRTDFLSELQSLVPESFGVREPDQSQTLADLPSLNPLDYGGSQWDSEPSLPWEAETREADAEEILDLLTEDQVDTLGWKSLESGSHCPINEQGDSIHFYTEQMVASLDWTEDILPLLPEAILSLLTR